MCARDQSVKTDNDIKLMRTRRVREEHNKYSKHLKEVRIDVKQREK